MGRGDKKTKKGKITIGTFGKVRPHKQNTAGTSIASDEGQSNVGAKKKNDSSAK